MSKSVDEAKFKEYCDLMLSGKMHPDVAAYLLGLSRPTFDKRVNQFYCPETYGEVPPDFFDGFKGDWEENPKWIKTSAYVKKYLEREEERKERQRKKEEYKRMIAHRDEFLKASKLPRLED